MAKSYIRASRNTTKPPGRLVDVFAGKDSIAGTVKRQRKALESGDSSMGNPVMGENSSDEVLKRGYLRNGDDDE